MMKTFIAIVALLGVFATNALAASVHSYHRSRPDGTVTNNYSYKGNTNPYTGKVGTNRYLHDKTSPNYVGPTSGHNSSR